MTRPILPILPAMLIALSLAACSSAQQEPAPEAAAAPLVSVVELSPSSITVWDELPARITALRTAEVRAQVSGLIVKRLFKEGSEVKKGEPLFQLDNASYAADVASAEATLQKTKAVLAQASAEKERADALKASDNISDQAYDLARSQQAQALADVAQAEAALNKTRLLLNLATIKAPLEGLIGAATLGEGALAEATSTLSLATIQQIGQVHVDIRQPASRLDHLRGLARTGLKEAGSIPIEVLAGEDEGGVIAAKALFSDISVDEGTGNVRLRAVADNPDRRLLPGMYVRARVPRGVYPDALSVPQQAVIRDTLGAPSVYVVGADSKAVPTTVTLGELVEGRYIVTTGLKAGDRVVVEGQDKLSSTVEVRAVPFGQQPAEAAAADAAAAAPAH